MSILGVEAASTGRKQPLKLADKLLPQVAGSLCGWCRNCFRRLLASSVGGAETVSTGRQCVCGWCRNCFHRLPAGPVGGAEIASQKGTVEGNRTCFHRLPAASAAGAEPAPAVSPQPLRPGVEAPPTRCRQALRPAPEQAASNDYGGCRSCLHRPEIVAASSLCGWCRNCFHRLPAGSGGWCRNCLHRLPMPVQVAQRLLPQAASRLCGRWREAEPASRLVPKLLPQAASRARGSQGIASGRMLRQPAKRLCGCCKTGCQQGGRRLQKRL